MTLTKLCTLPVFMACFLGVLFLSGCGFQSLNKPNLNGGAQYAVLVQPIPERVGQLLQQDLQDDFLVENPNYKLSVEIEEQIRYLAIRDDATASYGRLEITGYYKLLDAENKVVLNDFARSEAGYTIVDSEYASLKAEEDARLKALATLADKISQRVTVGLRTNTAVGVQ